MADTSMKLYRIRRKSTGLFAATGKYTPWTKVGKFYMSAGAAKIKLTALLSGAYNGAYYTARSRRREQYTGSPFGKDYYAFLSAHEGEFKAAGERAKAEILADLEVLELNLEDLPGTVLDLTEFRKTKRSN